MNRVLRIATLLAASGCAPPVTERVLRVREDGGVEDLPVGVHLPSEPRIDDARAAAMLREFEARPAPLRTEIRPRPRYAPLERPRKDRSKAKAARKARKKNRGR